MNAKDRPLGRLRGLRVCGAILAALTAGLAPGPVLARAAGHPLVARVEGGLVRGQIERGVIAFKGIPYAAPPVGARRWAPPQPVRPWNGVRRALAYGPDCMQVLFPGDAAPERTVPQENCLYLNVWRPRGASVRNLPVMVWIYGGGFVNGGSSPAVYNGTRFARDGVVLVSFNYRLGNFGFFAFPALTRQDRGQLLGDYAFMDQLAALRWVQRNIRAFGGDPHNVTVFGESAGGMSVNNLLISPLAKGLFQRAIIESGGGRPHFPAPPCRIIVQRRGDGCEAGPSLWHRRTGAARAGAPADPAGLPTGRRAQHGDDAVRGTGWLRRGADSVRWVVPGRTDPGVCRAPEARQPRVGDDRGKPRRFQLPAGEIPAGAVCDVRPEGGPGARSLRSGRAVDAAAGRLAGAARSLQIVLRAPSGTARGARAGVALRTHTDVSRRALAYGWRAEGVVPVIFNFDLLTRGCE